MRRPCRTPTRRRRRRCPPTSASSAAVGQVQQRPRRRADAPTVMAASPCQPSRIAPQSIETRSPSLQHLRRARDRVHDLVVAPTRRLSPDSRGTRRERRHRAGGPGSPRRRCCPAWRWRRPGATASRMAASACATTSPRLASSRSAPASCTGSSSCRRNKVPASFARDAGARSLALALTRRTVARRRALGHVLDRPGSVDARPACPGRRRSRSRVRCPGRRPASRSLTVSALSSSRWYSSAPQRSHTPSLAGGSNASCQIFPQPRQVQPAG